MTTPLGYITLWELRQRVADKVARDFPESHGDEDDWEISRLISSRVYIEISRLIESGTLPLFLERGFGPGYSIRRIPGEDLMWLRSVLPEAIESGRFPKQPTKEDLAQEAEANNGDDFSKGPLDDFNFALTYHEHLRTYCGAQPLIKNEHVEVLFPQKIHDVPQRSGAQGRPPKSMHVLMDEHDRRVAANEPLEPTLEGQSKALLAWLKETNPSAPRPGWKTVRNNLMAKSRNKNS